MQERARMGAGVVAVGEGDRGARSGPRMADFFVCIGAQKAGTTWLARILSGHPDLFMSPVKEIHYFDHVQGLTQHLSDKKRGSRRRKFHQRMWTQPHRFSEHWRQWSWYRTYLREPIDDNWYVSLFEERAGRRFAGEATPEYAIVGEQGLRHLQRLAPAARVLFILRNPVTRAWSQALHHCRTTGRDAIRLSTDELIAVMDEAPNFAALCDYAATLRDLAAVFPADQTEVLFYEDMHRDRAAALEQVCGFIGVPFAGLSLPGLGRRFNTSQEVGLPGELRRHLRERLAGQAETVRARIGRVPESWAREFGG
jgi:hypothetical protein